MHFIKNQIIRNHSSFISLFAIIILFSRVLYLRGLNINYYMNYLVIFNYSTPYFIINFNFKIQLIITILILMEFELKLYHLFYFIKANFK